MGEPRRLVVVVKYSAPTTRISGIVEFLRVLLRELNERWDVHVVSYDAEGTGRGPIDLDGYSVHRVGFPFPVTPCEVTLPQSDGTGDRGSRKG